MFFAFSPYLLFIAEKTFDKRLTGRMKLRVSVVEQLPGNKFGTELRCVIHLQHDPVGISGTTAGFINVRSTALKNLNI